MKQMKNNAGVERLKRDLKSNTFAPLYVLYGEETYLKEKYLSSLKKQVVDPTFADFNLQEFEGKTLTYEQLSEAIDSLPAMSEKKLIVVTDFDLFKPPAEFSDKLSALLADLPDYICLVFYYDLLTNKPDSRTQLYKQLVQFACFAEFSHLTDDNLIKWIIKQAKTLDRSITADTAKHLIFQCGNDMTNLVGEIEKAAAHTTTNTIEKKDIFAVCSPVLDAVIFDLTDAITDGKFDKAIQIVESLLAQKNNEIAIFTTIMRHIQRVYAVKLCDNTKADSRRLMEMVGSKSAFYVQRLQSAARKMPLAWLRRTASQCARTDFALKDSAVNQQKLIELSLLQMASDWRDLA